MGLASFNAMRRRQAELEQSTNAAAEDKTFASADVDFDSMKKSELIEYLDNHHIQYGKYQTVSELRDLAKFGG